MKINLYLCDDVHHDEMGLVICRFLNLEGHEVIAEKNPDLVIRFSRGKINPKTGFMFLIDQAACYNMFDVVKALDKLGLKRC
jgi:hypothetical protein